MTEEGFDKRLQRLVGRPVFWALFLAVLMTFHIGRAMLQPPLPALPEIQGKVIRFELTDQRGGAFGSYHLNGAVWVASLMCTKCPAIDPKVAENMQDIQHRSRNLGNNFHLVSITVDRKNDAPAALDAYATELRASTGRWSFLTGDDAPKVIASLYQDEGAAQPNATGLSVPQGQASKLVLVDQGGHIRGTYDLRNAEAEVQRLLTEAGLMVNRPWRPAPMAPVTKTATGGAASGR